VRGYIESGVHIEASFLCDLKMSVLPIKIQVLRQLLESYADRFEDQFIVVTETQVRFGKPRT